MAPTGPVYQAGTLSGNPLAMAAGYTMLKELDENPSIFTSLDKKAKYLHEGLDRVLTGNGVAHTINRLGSMISVHFSETPVIDFATSSNAASGESFKIFFHKMLKQGIYIAPSAYETWFLCNALTYDDIDKTICAAKIASKGL